MKSAVLALLLAGLNVHGQLTYSNYNAQTTIVAYGSNFTYTIAWNEHNTYNLSAGQFGVYYFSPIQNNIYSVPFYPTYYATNGVFTYTINGVSGSDDGAYYIDYFYFPNANYTTESTPVYMHVSPAILTQPQNTTCISGSTISMGIAAGPSTATFQWIDSASGVVKWTGASFSPTTANNGERVYCKISNSYGSVSSTSAVLTVGLPPTIASQPTNVITTLGSGAIFSIAANGTQPMYYQWYKNGISIQGANLNYIILPSVTNTDAATYQVAITNGFGNTNSASVSLSFPIAPQSMGIVNSGTAGVSVQFQGTPSFNYAVQATTNLAPPIHWQPLLTNSTDANGILYFTDSNAVAYPARFYRATIP